MTGQTHYAIRGGIAGRERLRMLARTLHASTSALFDRLGVGAGLALPGCRLRRRRRDV